jgi:ADP-heptose:LPS heptosyltransferase
MITVVLADALVCQSRYFGIAWVPCEPHNKSKAPKEHNRVAQGNALGEETSYHFPPVSGGKYKVAIGLSESQTSKPMTENYTVHRDCRHFQGDRPCKPHKDEGVICRNCPHYDPISCRILIIKLGAMGDVIRTTPILTPLRQKYPKAEITWMTHTPEVVPTRSFHQDAPDSILPWTWDAVTTVLHSKYHILINLDKDADACAVAQSVGADEKFGFGWEGNRCQPFNNLAWDKFLTGIDDSLSRANRKSYPQEIMEMCGLEYRKQQYILDPHLEQPVPDGLPSIRPLVGLNTGCSPRWTSRIWPEQHWVRLAILLRESGYGAVLFGGKDEDQKNRRIAVASHAIYPGTFPFSRFVRMVGEIDLMVTSVTMAMHVAIGLGKKLVLLNNIFNRHEFELYGRGAILEPQIECDCYYQPTCKNNCISTITPTQVIQKCRQLLS